MNMHSPWQQPSHSLPVQPIQPWQLADAQHAVHLAEIRLAEAEHAFSREAEQLLTSIAAHEHSAKVREANIRDLRARITLRDREIQQSQTELAEFRAEYSAETRRMREVVSDHQRTAARRESEYTSLTARFERSEAALDQALQHNEQLVARLEKLTRDREAETSTTQLKLTSTQERLANSQDEVIRLRQQLDDTETQHKSDVETLQQELSETLLAATETGQTVKDLDQLCDRRAAELRDANDMVEQLQAELQQVRESSVHLKQSLNEKQTELAEVIELSESIDGQLTSVVQDHGREVEQLNTTLSAKEAEAEQRKVEMRELAAQLVKRETEFKAQLDELSANHQMTKDERRQELRDLAQCLVRRENEFKSQLDELSARHQMTKDERRQELRDLAQCLVRRENEFKTDIERAKRETQAEADKTVEQLNLQVQKLEYKLSESLPMTKKQRRAELRELGRNLVRREAEYKKTILQVKDAADLQLSETSTHLQSEVQRLQEVVYSLEQSSNDREAIVVQLNEQIAEMQSAHHDAIAQVQQQAQAEYSQTQQQFQTQIQHLSSQTYQSQSDLQTVQNQLAETEQALVVTQQELQATTPELLAKEQELDAVRQDRRAVQQELQETKDRLKEAESAMQAAPQADERIAELQEHYQHHLQQRETQLAEQVQHIQQLQLQLNERDGEAQVIRSEAVELNIARIDELQSQLVEKESLLAKTQLELEQKKAELDAQQAQLAERSQDDSQQNQAAAELSLQTAELSQQVATLQESNQQLDTALKSKTKTIVKHREQLVALKARFEQLRSAPVPPPPAAADSKSNEAQLKQKYREQVAQLKGQYNEQLDRCQRAEFAVTQLDRTVAWMEQNSNSLQEDLQREAAARRKAESALKQRAGASGPNSIEQAISTQIEMDEQIKRLTRELDATRKIRQIERQQADAELKKIRRELSRRVGNSPGQRAA